MPTPVTYPTLMPQPFASVSGTSTFGGVNPISTGSVSPFASLADGFPLLTMLPVQEGGVPPQGPDFNGILNWITQHVVYLNAGGQYYFSSALAIAIGGYPIGAVLQLNSHSGMVISTAANNTTDPNSSMVGWSAYGSGGGGGGSWPPSGTPSILTTLGSLANSAGLLANNGTGTLSWVPNPFVNGTAAPTVGTWAVGAICWNSGVTATTTPGWICTTAGTPGTWTPLPQTVPNLTLTSPASPATITMPGVSSTLPYFTSTPTSTNIIPYASGTAGLLAFATTANYGVLITDVAGLPFALAGAAGVLIGSASSSPTWSTYLPAAQMPALTGDVTNTAGTVATTVGGIKGTSVPTLAAGYLHYNGSAFSWATPAAASWPVSGTPAIVSALGSLANAAGFLENNGSGTLSWVNPSGMTNPFTLIGQLLVCSAGGSPGTPAALPTATGTLSCSGTTVSWANIVLTPTGGSPATVTLASGMTFAVTGTNATATLAFPASNTTTITMPTVTSTLAFWSGSAPNSNQVAYSIGTTGALGFVTAATYGVLISGSTGTPVMLAGAAGVLVGSASTPPAWSLAPSGLTSINNVALTAPASLATLTFASGSTMTTTGAYAWTLAVPGAYTYTLPSATSTLAGLGNANTWSAAQTFSSTINNIMFTAPASTVTLALASGSSFTTTGAFTWGLSVPGAYTYTLPGSTSTLMATTTSVLAAQMPALTGDVTTVAGAVATTLATTQGAVHTWSLVQTFSATDVHTLGCTLTASAAVATNGYVGQDSTQKAMGTYQNGLKQMVVGCIFTQTATGTNGAATAITNILGTGVGTAVLPASYSLIGKTIRIKVRGTVTTAAAPGTTVITLYLSAGTPVTVVAMSTAITPTASMTSMPFDIEFDMTFRTTTTAIGAGKLTINSATTAVSSTVIGIATTTAATIVAATSYTIQVCSTNSVASGCVYTTQTCTMEVLQ